MDIGIEGMHSIDCVARVRRALEKIEGLRVREVRLNLAIVDGAAKQEAAAMDAIEKAGYRPHLSA